MEIMTLKVSGKTTAPAALKSAIVGYVKDGKTVHLDSIGVLANYVATKGIILAKGQLSMQGVNLSMVPIFQELKIEEPTDKEFKTAIRWVLKGCE